MDFIIDIAEEFVIGFLNSRYVPRPIRVILRAGFFMLCIAVSIFVIAAGIYVILKHSIAIGSVCSVMGVTMLIRSAKMFTGTLKRN
ncbi:hypothetical protein [Ruminococcus albus]|uniref:Uncharacterized protein n=1 Tax=Ruminococcus albus TaxID=1264 RepID=A0A1H7IVM1_RUMAL|nr:hypothetical protein [Ruminococcus albus]SEK65700.1 hypothetical protein SAMN05216469_10491 [Ruminococcus albus]